MPFSFAQSQRLAQYPFVRHAANGQILYWVRSPLPLLVHVAERIQLPDCRKDNFNLAAPGATNKGSIRSNTLRSLRKGFVLPGSLIS